MTVASIGTVELFTAVNDSMSPVPLADKPMEVVLLFQLNVVPATDDVKFITDVGAPLHNAAAGG